MSDGCLRKEGRNKTSYAIRIGSNDQEIIEWLHDRLCVGNKIYKQNKNYSIKYRNIESINFMMEYGLKERKSLDMIFPNIPDEYFYDFIRGFFDGDGSIVLRKTKYNTYAQISFTCGSKDFLNALKNELSKRNIESHIYKDGRKNNNSYYLRIIKRSEIEKIFYAMYSDVRDNAMLYRKYKKFLNYLDCKPKYNITNRMI